METEMEMNHQRKPNFFIVGAPKCGTTALHTYLGLHPDIFVSEPKEPNYFGSLVESFAKSDVQYVKYCYSNWGKEKMAGEATPLYLACPEAAKRIHGFNAEAKIIIMLRNPVEMMYSLHSEFSFTGSEEEFFFEALKLEENRLQGISVKTNSKLPYKLAYKKMASFPDQVQRYLSLFGQENVLVLLQEDMHVNTATVYKQALEFLGVDPNFSPDFPRVNANKNIRSKFIRKQLMHPPEWLRAFGRLLIPSQETQHAIRHKMRILNKRINSTVVSRKPIPIELYNQLLAEKLPEIDALSKLLDRDLSHWLKIKE